MFMVFFLLCFALLVCMLIFLVKPALLARNGNTPPTRGKIAMVFSSLSLVFFILSLLTVPEVEQKSNPPITDRASISEVNSSKPHQQTSAIEPALAAIESDDDIWTRAVITVAQSTEEKRFLSDII